QQNAPDRQRKAITSDQAVKNTAVTVKRDETPHPDRLLKCPYDLRLMKGLSCGCIPENATFFT
ncbi:hypothetical protein, partial [Acetobacter oeni]|uniref:hypothetical protein n=1 Tax=Acetobacter oeni TaxID=304077 RepID=UPI001A7E769B